jgi:hypothetical protein
MGVAFPGRICLLCLEFLDVLHEASWMILVFDVVIVALPSLEAASWRGVPRFLFLSVPIAPTEEPA